MIKHDNMLSSLCAYTAEKTKFAHGSSQGDIMQILKDEVMKKATKCIVEFVLGL